MRHSIATVSVSGLLEDKLPAIAAAGFDGVEIFDNDLIGSQLSPREVAQQCADLGLRIELFQPFRDAEGLSTTAFAAAEHRFRRKLDVMEKLGCDTILVCSNVNAEAIDDAALRAAQLHRLGQIASDHGVRLAYEALAWGRHVSRVRDAWRAVCEADHAAVTLAVDTFHMLARGDGAEALQGIPGDRVGFLQVADAPLLEMGVLEWSRHHRCFPGEGMLAVDQVVAAVLDAGFTGPLSLEVFSDHVREAAPRETAVRARRSLIFLEDQVATAVTTAKPEVRRTNPPPQRVDMAFVELPESAENQGLLESLGFVLAGRHHSKPVTWWRQGDAHVILNAATAAAAVGVRVPSVREVAARATALLWPPMSMDRGQGEALLPGLESPSGLHWFVSGDAGSPDHWQRDFEPEPIDPGDAWSIDHVGVLVSPSAADEDVAFQRTLFDLRPAPLEEFMERTGRLLSRALRPARGASRLIVNAEDVSTMPPRTGINQIAYAVPDVFAAARTLNTRGVDLLGLSENYYAELDARYRLDRDFLNALREHRLLYERSEEGELVHAYTAVQPGGFYIEILQRFGAYDGYGSTATTFRLAAQARLRPVTRQIGNVAESVMS